MNENNDGVKPGEGTTPVVPPATDKPSDEPGTGADQGQDSKDQGQDQGQGNGESGSPEPTIPKSRFDEVYGERNTFKERAEKAEADLQRQKEEKLKAEGKESELWQEKAATYIRKDYESALKIVDSAKIPDSLKASIKSKPFAHLPNVTEESFAGLSPVEQLEKAAKILTEQLPGYLTSLETELGNKGNSDQPSEDNPQGGKADPNTDLGNPSGGASKRTWTASEVDKMSLADYRKHKPEIDKAIAEGRFIADR